MRPTLTASLVLALFAVPAAAQQAVPAEELYLSRCAACHGLEGQGDGPMSALLTVPVPDLTMIAARNGGLFPRIEVVQTVDGRRDLRGHGGPMPVYGRLLGGGSAALDGPDGTVVETSGEVVAIVRYLENLQAE